MQPAHRIRERFPEFVPEAPCVLHFTAGSYGATKRHHMLGNGAFRFVQDFEV